MLVWQCATKELPPVQLDDSDYNEEENEQDEVKLSKNQNIRNVLVLSDFTQEDYDKVAVRSTEGNVKCLYF